MPHRQSMLPRGKSASSRAFAVLLVTLAIVPVRALSPQGARTRPVTGAALVRKYANSEMGTILLREPPVRAALVRLLGDRLPQLERSLDVSGSVDVIDGSLAVSGNAPHRGGEEEGIVCIASYDLSVHAAILSAGSIDVFTRSDTYETLPVCIKDWITQVNSGHHDRVEPPRNVRVVTRR